MADNAVREAQQVLASERGELARAEAHLAGWLEDLKALEQKVEAAKERVNRAAARVADAEAHLRHVQEQATVAGRLAAAAAARATTVRSAYERAAAADAALATALRAKEEAEIDLASVVGAKGDS